MERWLSWSKAHDWKSCIPYKGIKGSNPFLSATNNRTDGCGYFFVSARNSARAGALFLSPFLPFTRPPCPVFLLSEQKGDGKRDFL